MTTNSQQSIGTTNKPQSINDKHGMLPSRRNAIVANQVVLWISHHWVAVFIVLFGVFIALPWLAPILMEAGATGGAKVIYTAYSFECHQLPERAYYLFGTKSMYSLAEIQATWETTNNPLLLRQFVGNEQMGYKVAWCDRTTAMYGSLWLLMLLWSPVSKRISPLPFRFFALFTLPIVVDGGTHFVSDFMGLGVGFCETNLWLATLTENIFPYWFYATDLLGSFNWWMRLLTGFLFSVGLFWLAYPQAEDFFTEMADRVEMKFRIAGIRQR